VSKKPSTVTTTIRMTGAEARKLKAAAKADDRSMSSVIRLAIRDYLDVRKEG